MNGARCKLHRLVLSGHSGWGRRRLLSSARL
jgi:hypothetical protein